MIKEARKMRVNDMVREAVKDNLIGKEDITEAKTILTWIEKGPKEAKKVSKDAVENLIKNGFVTDDGKRLQGCEPHEPTIWFIMAILGAKGLIMQRKEARSP